MLTAQRTIGAGGAALPRHSLDFAAHLIEQVWNHIKYKIRWFYGMNSKFLSKEGDCLTFVGLRDFESTLGTLNLTVPSRISRRKSYHRERFCAIRYLKAVVHHNQINFPFSICKSERPDFILALGDGKTIGLEHSDITTEKWQQDLTRIAKLLKRKHVLFGSLPNDNLTADEASSKWASLALIALEKKINDLNKADFKQLDSYELLLYSNTDLPNVDQNEVIPKLSTAFNQKYKSTEFPRLYTSLSIAYGNDLWLRTMQIHNLSTQTFSRSST
ncbi:MAG: hypothetical protein Q7R79_04010 [bacterium]|nr:hypothetical protein [bacterium]